MNKAFKKKWVTALRSGEYKQGEGALARSGRFCCLGVARHLNDPLDVRDCWGFLHRSVAEKIGLTDCQQEGLVSMNDAGVPFEVIAGFIDQHL